MPIKDSARQQCSHVQIANICMQMAAAYADVYG
jgi:hypothetical protein